MHGILLVAWVFHWLPHSLWRAHPWLAHPLCFSLWLLPLSFSVYLSFTHSLRGSGSLSLSLYLYLSLCVAPLSFTHSFCLSLSLSLLFFQGLCGFGKERKALANFKGFFLMKQKNHGMEGPGKEKRNREDTVDAGKKYIYRRQNFMHHHRWRDKLPRTFSPPHQHQWCIQFLGPKINTTGAEGEYSAVNISKESVPPLYLNQSLNIPKIGGGIAFQKSYMSNGIFMRTRQKQKCATPVNEIHTCQMRKETPTISINYLSSFWKNWHKFG